MPFNWRFLLIIPALLMAAGCIYLSIVPNHVLEISVVPRSGSIRMRDDKVVVISEDNGPIFFEISGDVNPSIPKVTLKVRAPSKPDFEECGDFVVSQSKFLGTVKCVGSEIPITGSQNYPYQIESTSDKTRLSEGNIQVRGMAVISASSQFFLVIIGSFGLLASVLQIIQFFKWGPAPKAQTSAGTP